MVNAGLSWLNNEEGYEEGWVQAVPFNQPAQPHEYDNPMYMHEPASYLWISCPRVDITFATSSLCIAYSVFSDFFLKGPSNQLESPPDKLNAKVFQVHKFTGVVR